MAKIANVAPSTSLNSWATATNALADRLSQFAINNSSLYANTITANNSLRALKNLTVSGNTILSGTVGIATNSPIYSLQIGKNPSTSSGVGISSVGNIVASGTLAVPQINSSGIITATNGFISGIGTAVQISTVGNKLFFTVAGVGQTSLTLY
jgi:hypothetical protein